MRTLRTLFIAILSASFLSLGACATHDSSDSHMAANGQYGVVKSINETTETQSGVNVGTLIGGAVGALAGHQIGSGRGNTAATVAGAVGGAVIGTRVGNNGNGDQMYKIGVKLQDGSMVTVNQKADVADLKVGDRVKIENDEAVPV